MANSLTEWLATDIASSIAATFSPTFVESSKVDDLSSLLDDIAFQKGAKVQIIRFYAPHLTREAQQLLQHSQDHHPVPDESVESETQPLWAIVGDRSNHTVVSFSPQCVTRFDGTHSRELISLRGAIISLRSFRPSLSFLPSHLNTIQQRAGPFAAPLATDPVRLSLVLQVESFNVLGSINEVIFYHNTEDVSIALFARQDSVSSAFKTWCNCLVNEGKKKGNGSLQFFSSVADRSGTTNDSSIPTIPAEAPIPPPFQRPKQATVLPWKKFLEDSAQSSNSAPLSSSSSSRNDNPWGDFVLSQMDREEEIELDDETEEETYNPMQGTQEEVTMESLFASMDEKYTTNSTEDDVDHVLKKADVDKYDPPRQTSLEISSQVSTLPATYPDETQPAKHFKGKGKVEYDLHEEDSGIVWPPTITDSTSLPFLFVDDQGAANLSYQAKGCADAAQLIKQTRAASFPITSAAPAERSVIARGHSLAPTPRKRQSTEASDWQSSLDVRINGYLPSDKLNEQEGYDGVEPDMPIKMFAPHVGPASTKKSKLLSKQRANTVMPISTNVHENNTVLTADLRGSSGGETVAEEQVGRVTDSSGLHTSVSIPAKEKWNKYIRQPTAEEIEEREQTFASRIDLIVD